MTLFAEGLGLSWGDRIAALAILVTVAAPIIGLLFRQNSQQAGTNARLDGIKDALNSHGSKLDRHEDRLDAVEQKQVKHDIFFEKFQGCDQSCQTPGNNPAS